MVPGDVIEERFQIERAAGAGGMGMVYRGIDRTTGLAVAVKVLQRDADLARFGREARILSGVRHPAVVRYVAQGSTSDGAPYLAMEWLDGEELGARLAAGRLLIGESVTLARRVADALAFLHERGVVHRDLKPSNLFLRGGRVEDVTLLDFGIALPLARSRELTRAGGAIGTPGYMAPEQARGDRGVGPAADLFSLGCVLFQCLTGQPPFTGEHVIALLAKVLIEEAPRVTTLRPEVPPALADLVDRMMRKEPRGRPESAAAVLAALDALGARSTLDATLVGPAIAVPASLQLTTGEQRLLSVILVGAEEPGKAAGEQARAADEPASRAAAATVDVASLRVPVDTLRAVAGAHGAALDHLADGTSVLTLTGEGAATDRAALSARCALAVRAAAAARPIVLAMGRGRADERAPVGEVIDRAAALLRGVAGKGGAPAIEIDELTSGLLGDGFEIGAEDGRRSLRAAREAPVEDARLFLGRATPCVGRDRELRTLEEELDACISEPSARVVLVTGEAGTGKSRLRHELVRRARAGGGPLEIWIARGDPLSALSPFGLLGQVVRGAAGVQGGEPIEARRAKLAARVGRHLGSEAQRVAELLGELCGTPFPDEGNVQLRAARQDLVVMGDQMRCAWIDFMDAECAAQPVLLVLEDLHWGDLPTVQYLDAAMRLLPERPFLVLALARPDVDKSYPALWSRRALVTIQLGGLSRKACAQLARAALGDEAGAAVLDRLWTQSAGNPLFLEELLRAAASGKGGDAPPTVLAMVQARLEDLPPAARRVLRAASVFGQRFWQGGAAALLGGAPSDAALRALTDEEVITRARDTKLAGEVEYAFRHSLMREAAYAMLTEEDRAMGHRLAGAWLESAGEGSASVLAEHFERGGRPGRAAVCYRRAAEHAFEGNDLTLALAWTERAIDCAARGASLDSGWIGEVRLLQARMNLWRGQTREALACALEAMRRLRAGSAPWCRALADVTRASGRSHELAQVEACAAALLESSSSLGAGPAERDDEGTVAAHAIALAQTARITILVGMAARAHALLGRSESLARGIEGDPVLLAEVLQARSVHALVKGDLSTSLELTESTRVRWRQIGDLRNACVLASNVGYMNIQLGLYDAAEEASRSALAEADRLGLAAVRATATHNLGLALVFQEKLQEGIAVLEEARSLARDGGDRRITSFCAIHIGRFALLAGDLERAVRESRGEADAPATPPGLRALALAVLSFAERAQGHGEDSSNTAGRAMEILTSVGDVEEGEAFIRLSHIEALRAAGHTAAACDAAAGARDRLLSRAAEIADPELRRSFLSRVPENARTLDLARELANF